MSADKLREQVGPYGYVAGEGFSTIALHHGHKLDTDNRARAPPIFQSTSFQFKSSEHGKDLFALSKNEMVNGRTLLENLLADGGRVRPTKHYPGDMLASQRGHTVGRLCHWGHCSYFVRTGIDVHSAPAIQSHPAAFISQHTHAYIQIHSRHSLSTV